MTEWTLWPDDPTPGTVDTADGGAYTLGVEFETTAEGWVTGVDWYQGPTQHVTQIGLWEVTGAGSATLLASAAVATATQALDDQWVSQAFDDPVRLTIGDRYRVGCLWPSGRYPSDAQYWTGGGTPGPGGSGITSGPLAAFNHDDSTDGQGTFNSGGTLTNPTTEFNRTNYWLSPVFDDGDSAGLDTAIDASQAGHRTGDHPAVHTAANAEAGTSLPESGILSTNADHSTHHASLRTWALTRGVAVAAYAGGFDADHRAIHEALHEMYESMRTVTHGRWMGAWNSGIRHAGLTPGDLTTYSGASTITTNGATIENQRIASGIDINADNVTFRNCLFDGGDGSGIALTFGGITEISATSDGTLIEDCTYLGVYPDETNDGSCILNRGTNTTVRRVDLSGTCNLFRDVGTGTLLEFAYLHDPHPDDGGASHRDVLELFDATDFTARDCRLVMDDEETACFNLAPFGGGSADNCRLVRCHLDGGNMHIVVDAQGGGDVTNTRIIDCTFGGHTNAAVIGEYVALNNADSRAIVTTEGALASDPSAILWTGNTWQETQAVHTGRGWAALSPDNDGDPVTV